VIFRLPKGHYVADIEVARDAPLDVAEPGIGADSQPALIVLPFENLGGDPTDEYFADGITDDLITDMSKLSGLKVIAHNSAFTYKGHKPTAEQLGQELRVTHVLEGSVRRAGRRVRINAQLVECATGGHLWAERFDRELIDIFALQDEVGRRIVTALSVALTATDRYRFFDRRTENLEAYDLVLRAAQLDWSRPKIDEAYALLQKAVDLDPEYGLAQAKIAMNRWYAVYCGWVDEAIIEESLGSATRAAELDPDNADVQSVYGFINFWFGSLAVSDAAGDKAITLDPTNARALERRAICLLDGDRCDEAEDYLARAKALNPHEPYYYPRGLLAFTRGNTAEALELFTASAERFPSFMPTRVYLASAYTLNGAPRLARAQIDVIRELSSDATFGWLWNRWSSSGSNAGKRFVEGFREAWEAAMADESR